MYDNKNEIYVSIEIKYLRNIIDLSKLAIKKKMKFKRRENCEYIVFCLATRDSLEIWVDFGEEFEKEFGRRGSDGTVLEYKKEKIRL